MRINEEFLPAINLCLNTRCNICKNKCPLYKKNNLEFNSPRGKLELIFEVLEGKIRKDEVLKEVSCSLECEECYPVCPYEINIPKIFSEFIKICQKD
ncbi:MAG: 4Fe-4S dicluster domain-containing protein [Candidatus Hodarchaeales archaeon]|jgi:Fe-S oxidoreductase